MNPIDTLLNIKDKIPFFSDFTNNELKDLISEVKILTYKNKEIIFEEGETTGDYFYYLIKGKLNVSKQRHVDAKSTIKITILNKPCLFGEIKTFAQVPRTVTIEVAEDKTLVLAFKIKDFEKEDPISKFHRSVIKELCNKLIEINMRYY